MDRQLTERPQVTLEQELRELLLERYAIDAALTRLGSERDETYRASVAGADDLADEGAVKSDIEGRVERWRESGWERFDQNSQPYTVDEIRREFNDVGIVSTLGRTLAWRSTPGVHPGHGEPTGQLPVRRAPTKPRNDHRGLPRVRRQPIRPRQKARVITISERVRPSRLQPYPRLLTPEQRAVR